MRLKPRHWMALHNEDKLPRKVKKAIIGKKMNKTALRKRLSKVVITAHKYPESAEISDRFCPKCGCEVSRSTGNMAGYPERYVKCFCIRCNFLLEMSDNSPYYHCLEFKENNYEFY